MKDQKLRAQLVELLSSQNAHVNFQRAFRDFPERYRGEVPQGFPYSAWQLLEHLRIAQWDILDFCRNPNYQELPWPEGYWSKTTAPPTSEAWEKSIAQFLADQQAFAKLITDPQTDLFAQIPWGSGQTYLREALLIADHNAYHIGQVVLLRKLLGIWHSK